MFPSSISSPPPRSAALAALRSATAQRHGGVEALVSLHELHDADHYGRVLQALAAFLPAWERAVLAALPQRLAAWCDGQARVQRLQEDLAALALRPVAAAAPPLRWQGLPAALGALYVMEGSALGGQVIARELRTAGVAHARATAYFHGLGADTGPRWRRFLALLSSELDSRPESHAAACAAACDTFDALGAVLRSVLHERAAAA